MSAYRLLPLAALLAAALPASEAPAQTRGDTVVVPGPEYAAEGLRARFFGQDYRDLWSRPLRVPLLDLSTFAGGLTPTGRGGGLQTKSVRFKGADGKEYAFRSSNKYPHLAREPALEGTFVADIIQDQTSSLHPAAALVVPPLAEALGIAHVAPRLVVMPDDPRLAEFREEFAGRLGQIEERPEDPADGGGGFAPFGRIIGTDRLLERLEESPEDRIDARAYLTARLFDLVLGDWDRHEDQWRWGETRRGGTRVWVPIPRDRDYAFVNYDGWFMDVARNFMANAVLFTPRIDNVAGLTLNARAIDHRFLTELERPVWDSIAGFVQRRLTDPVIDAAFARLPQEYRGERAAEMARTLRSRRDDLPRAARDFYGMLATEVDVRATDESDLAVVDRTGEGTVEVRLFELDRAGRPAATPYFRRAFTQEETNEVRLYLHGGDDRALVRGDVGESLMVRVVGGGGDDLMADSSRVRRESTKTAFYDGRGENRFVRGAATAVETQEYDPPEPVQGLSGESYRDWGAVAGYAPALDYLGTDGLVVGGGPTYTRYGFWKDPYAYKLSALGMIGLGSGEVAVQVAGDFRNTASRGGYSFLLRGSELESVRFYGLGNQTTAEEPNAFYVVRQDQLLGLATVNFGLPAGGRLRAGPIVKYTMSGLPPGTPFARENDYGQDFGQAGALVEADLDRRDRIIFPTRGAALAVGAASYAGVWDAEPFTEAHGAASVYLTPSLAWQPTLALRAGGKKVWGDFPLHESAFLGGSRTIRGYGYQRYAGDAMLYGNAELRAPLGTVKVLIRGLLGVHGLVDAGRVYLDGKSPGGWHTATGGGLWFRFAIRQTTLGASATYARGGDDARIYFKLGAPF